MTARRQPTKLRYACGVAAEPTPVVRAWVRYTGFPAVAGSL
jgi:hypothetical protein